MKWMMPVLLALALLQSGCSRDDERVQRLQDQLSEATSAANALEDRLLEGGELEASLRTQLETARREADELRARLAELPTEAADETEPLRREIAELKARIAELEQAPAPEAEPEPTPAAPAAEAPNAEHLARLDELMPAVKTSAGGTELDEMWELASRGNKALRDEIIRRVREWSSAEPDSARARVALATALTTRFADLDGQFMQQGQLAGEVKKELETALEIDPGYYDAVHFMAIMKANYPPFADEFKTAGVDLDKAIKMQESLPWEERFCDVYTIYSQWLRKQGKLAEAEAKTAAGLQKSPANEGLLAEQAAIKAAREAQGD